MVNVTLASKRPYLKVFQYILVSFFILFLVLVVLQQANPLNTRLERDSGIYIYVSNTLLKGGLPYVTAMETKPPGIFFIDAFALWIGDGTRWGIWAVEFLFLFFATCIGFYFLNLRFDFGPATFRNCYLDFWIEFDFGRRKFNRGVFTYIWIYLAIVMDTVRKQAQ